MYDIIKFGKEIKKIRESLNLSQEEVALKSFINISTIKRLEKGKVVPKIETIEILSLTYNQDLTKLLSDNRISDFNLYTSIIKQIELNLDNVDYNLLHDCLDVLEKIDTKNNSQFINNQVKQIILLVKGIIEKNVTNIGLSNKFLIKALRITKNNFNLINYQRFVYSEIEIRILMNLSFNMYRLQKKDLYINLLEFCKHSLEESDKLYSKVCHNLAFAYIRFNKFILAKENAELALESALQYKYYDGLPMLYYSLAMSKFKLKDCTYIEDIKKSIFLAESYKLDVLKNEIIRKCSNIGIEL